MPSPRTLLVLCTAIAVSSAAAACNSHRIVGYAIKSIPGGNGPTLDLGSAAECEASCCASAACHGWSWTPIARTGACPKNGCCFTKTATAAVINGHLEQFAHFTTGCIGFNCSAPPPTPAPPPPPTSPKPSFRYVEPAFAEDFVFASASDSYLRDPTTAVFDPLTRSWHLFSTHVPHSAGTASGYPGSVWHWSLNASFEEGPFARRQWTSEGAVLNASGTGAGTDAPAFDAAGVFTPGCVRECTTAAAATTTTAAAAAAAATVCTWYLFFGGVPDLTPGHREKVGLATAGSPWGPFVRDANNPVFSYTDANTQWCGADSAPARVDEIKCTVAGVPPRKLVVVKSVCANGTALPVLYLPASGSNASWAPPYAPAPNVRDGHPWPLVDARETCSGKGFEEPTLFRAATDSSGCGRGDGFLHLLGHNHGGACNGGRYAHFVSRSGGVGRAAWEPARGFGTAADAFTEPVPVPRAGDGVFGGAVMDRWVDFPRYTLAWLNVTYKWVEP
jgi:hypothetical protein